MKEKFAHFVSTHPIWTFIIGCGVILIIPALFTLKVSFLPGYLISGQVGDTIGGTTAPFIGLFSAILVYLSFQEQIKANKLLSDQWLEGLTIQNITAQINRIEDTIKSYSYPQYNPSNNVQEQVSGNNGIIAFGRDLAFVIESLQSAHNMHEHNPQHAGYRNEYERAKERLNTIMSSIQLRGIGHILNLMEHMIKYLESKETDLNKEAIKFNYDILTFIYYNDLRPTLEVISGMAESMAPFVGTVFQRIKSRSIEMEKTLNQKVKGKGK